ncbi:tyrosine-type recombinase/integrase [uncultured Paraglaciecola sp.]|uniref:tyrosine-type recombinase/integrase n=1 Tax=uncultured Paraglaciecola sp. TaxID=1765024 RepID=UPI0030D9AD5D
MTVKEVKNGYKIDFSFDNERFIETIKFRHSKSSLTEVNRLEGIFYEAIYRNDKRALQNYPHSKILRKAFKCESDSFTIDQYSSIWFGRHQANWSHTTIRDYGQKYRTHIKENFGDITLREFTPSMYHDWAKSQNLAGKTINHIRSILNQIFKEAYLDEVIDVNPIEKTRRSKVIQEEPEPFTQDEITKILAALETPYREFFQFAIWTGLRTGELLALRWQDIDLKNGLAHIRKNITLGKEKEPKTKGSIRKIEMLPEAIEALNSIKNSKYYDNFRVFIDPKTKTTYKYADGLRKYVWMPTLKRIGVTYRYPYQCRHTFASMMLSEGKNPMWVASQMGHADWGMIRKTYGRWIAN